jgi:outer membrane receptor for Fe3+-dicitrate
MRWSSRAFLALAALCCAVAGVRAEDEPRPPELVAAGETPDETRLQELVVEAQRPMSAASSREMNARDFRLRPHSTLIQILNNVPGLVVSQHQGGSKAPQWFLRGFDADHGTDIAVFADDMPINFVTRAHGQATPIRTS